MIVSTHRIRRLRWLIQSRSTEEALDIRRRLEQEWANVLLPALNRQFDQIADGNKMVQIPLLDLCLNVDARSVDDLFDRIPESMSSVLRTRIDALNAEFITSARSESWLEVETEAASLETLVEYLERGVVPWRVAQRPTQEVAAMFQSICREHQRQLARRLHQAPNETFLFRWMQLVADKDLDPIFDPLTAFINPAIQASVLGFARAVMKTDRHVFDLHTRIKMVARLLTTAISQPRVAEARSPLTIVQPVLSVDQVKDLHAFVTSLPSHVRQHVGPSRTHVDAKSTITSAKRAAAIVATQSPRDGSVTRHLVPTSLSTTQSTSMQSTSMQSTSTQSTSTQSTSPISRDTIVHESRPGDDFGTLVHHAGLIVIHPFLPRLFEAIGVIRGDATQIDRSQMARAAAVLHWIATKNLNLHEFELGFIKLFLGLRHDDQLPVSEGLVSQSDQDEVQTLLEAVVRHWEALKTTSVRTLRFSFLQRQGLLRKDDMGWKLHIERLPIDVLVDRLPWSISILKLPWSNSMLHTEW